VHLFDNCDLEALAADGRSAQAMGSSCSPRAAADSRWNRVAAEPDCDVLIMITTTANEQTLERLRSLCLSLPETSETSSWGTSEFQGREEDVRGVRAREEAGIDCLSSGVRGRRSVLGRKEFFVTPYGRGLWVSLWADGPVDWRAVADLVNRSYRSSR
jgi:hypothetical protein